MDRASFDLPAPSLHEHGYKTHTFLSIYMCKGNCWVDVCYNAASCDRSKTGPLVQCRMPNKTLSYVSSITNWFWRKW